MREGQSTLGGAVACRSTEKQAYYGDDNYQTRPAPAGSEIERELCAIESIIGHLAKQTETLEERLRVVLRPEPTSAGADGVSPTPNVPLAVGLSAFRSKLSYLSGRIETLTGRIDF